MTREEQKIQTLLAALTRATAMLDETGILRERIRTAEVEIEKLRRRVSALESEGMEVAS